LIFSHRGLIIFVPQGQNYKCINADEMHAAEPYNLGEPDVTYFWNLGMTGGPNINNWRFANPNNYLPEMKVSNTHFKVKGGSALAMQFCPL
jgi:hypothetical protein